MIQKLKSLIDEKFWIQILLRIILLIILGRILFGNVFGILSFVVFYYFFKFPFLIIVSVLRKSINKQKILKTILNSISLTSILFFISVKQKKDSHSEYLRTIKIIKDFRGEKGRYPNNLSEINVKEKEKFGLIGGSRYKYIIESQENDPTLCIFPLYPVFHRDCYDFKESKHIFID